MRDRVATIAAAALILASAIAGGGASSASAIIGGKAANPADWPFAVALQHRGHFFCGGSVIAPTVVLTAAHCANAKPRRHLTVAIGRARLRDDSAGEVISVVHKIVHPDYKRKERHDLALLILAQPTTAPPIAIATREEDAAATAPGMPVRVAGYGAKDAFGIHYPGVLKQTIEWVRARHRCRHIYRKQFTGATMICSIGRRFPHTVLHATVCSGDSGGPLVADTPAGPRLIGVSSYSGALCGLGLTPTVYARVSSGLQLIESVIGPPSG